MVVAVVIAVGRGAEVEHVQRDVAGSGPEHHQRTLAQRRQRPPQAEGTLRQVFGGVVDAGRGGAARVV